VPRWNTISISGYHIREAGSTATQEVAFTLSNAIAYVQGAIDRGLDVDSFAGRLSFFFACHNNFIEEIAKFRVARRMWAKIMRERFRAKDPRSWTLRFHTQTGGVTLTAQQPLNNVVRTTIQALAAVLGGTHIFPPRPSMRLTTDIFAYCSQEVPRWNTISISGYHIREAGSTAIQEVAFTLGNAIAYVQGAIERGLDVDSFAGRLSFFFACHNNFVEEIAKFRAARRMWARIMRERFGARDPRSWTLRFHTQTGGVTLTAQQPLNNVVRTTIQALAAVLGGTQSLHTNSWDEAYAPPSEEAVTIALRTQQVIAHESGVADVADPLGGAYFLEHLTNTIEREAFAYIDKIDSLGGSVAAIEQGFLQKEIQDSSYRHQQEVEAEQRVVVGVNRFVSPQPPITGLLRMDPEKARTQIQRLQEFRQRRNQAAVAGSLGQIESHARSEENLMPAFVEAVEAGATLGEICGVLRQVFGTQKEFLVF
jgi:methylmalonyl-CoA mutase N-terminal domain/subunit